MKKFFVLLLLLSSFLNAQNVVSKVSYKKIDSKYYSVVYDTISFVPLAVKYTLSREMLQRNVYVRGFAYSDLLSEKLQANRFDYDKRGVFDAGHLVPLNDMSFSVESAWACNEWINSAPQNKYLNRGVWKSLELFVDKKAMFNSGNVVVYVGLYLSEKKIGRITIPTYWVKKIIINKIEYCWKMPNEKPIYKDFDKYSCGCDEINKYLNSLKID